MAPFMETRLIDLLVVLAVILYSQKEMVGSGSECQIRSHHGACLHACERVAAFRTPPYMQFCWPGVSQISFLRYRFN